MDGGPWPCVNTTAAAAAEGGERAMCFEFSRRRGGERERERVVFVPWEIRRREGEEEEAGFGRKVLCQIGVFFVIGSFLCHTLPNVVVSKQARRSLAN